MNVEDIFDQFTKKRVLVIGDVMIDAYLRGDVTRISPEAPVPIINLRKSEDRLGGAANVALNLLSLGAEPILCAVIGEDDGAQKFNELLSKRGMSDVGMIKSSDRQTTIKTRVIGNNQHLLRIDEEVTSPLKRDEEDALISKAKYLINEGVDAVILEDYNKGLLTVRVIEAVIAAANEKNVIITVDPKLDNFLAYKNVTLFKPNLKELKEGLNVNFDISTERDKFEGAIDELEQQLGNQISFVTLSEHGVFVKEGNQKDFIPAHIRNIADVSGAGDTVISVATLCLCVGLRPKEVAEIANLSGGIVCEVSGVIPIDKQQLMEEVRKIVLA
ncbi:MAG: bifunctional ADP-heptose synthase [Crocinitomicaceae bacterium]|nr:bifunctional ADP-heptose synthase [Crocinitomicaceae bacterium]